MTTGEGALSVLIEAGANVTRRLHDRGNTPCNSDVYRVHPRTNLFAPGVQKRNTRRAILEYDTCSSLAARRVRRRKSVASKLSVSAQIGGEQALCLAAGCGR